MSHEATCPGSPALPSSSLGQSRPLPHPSHHHALHPAVLRNLHTPPGTQSPSTLLAPGRTDEWMGRRPPALPPWPEETGPRGRGHHKPPPSSAHTCPSATPLLQPDVVNASIHQVKTCPGAPGRRKPSCPRGTPGADSPWGAPGAAPVPQVWLRQHTRICHKHLGVLMSQKTEKFKRKQNLGETEIHSFCS